MRLEGNVSLPEEISAIPMHIAVLDKYFPNKLSIV